VVFGTTLGTGVGGGIVVDRRPLVGANAIAGEWGHNPLPLADPGYGPAVVCGCGRFGCIESWLNGAALARDYAKVAGRALEGPAIARLAAAGDDQARAAIAAYGQRLAVALAGVINLIDPDVIVLGGGLSALPDLCRLVPQLWPPLIVAPEPRTRLLLARFGAESGLRGAAWLPGARN
jgi:fructokinase